MARRKPEKQPPVEVSPGDLPPPELRVGALIEVWADGEGTYGSHFPASRRYRHARRRWSEGLSTAEECRRFRGFPSSPWSLDFLIAEGRREEAERRLAEAGVAAADIPALRTAAQTHPHPE